MGEIYSWVKNIIIFLVLTTIISNLLGKSNYKKYINLVIGIILVILVISPLLKLFKLGDTLDYFFSINILSTQAKDINGKLIEMEEGQMSAIIKEYKEDIKEQVSKLLKGQDLFLVSIEITVDEKEGSETFGCLEYLNVTASEIRQDTEKSSSEIEKVNIDSIEIGEEKEDNSNSENGILSPSEINVKNLLSDFYNMNPDNINISIQEQ
jgi:stage III sporulation protein AF